MTKFNLGLTIVAAGLAAQGATAVAQSKRHPSSDVVPADLERLRGPNKPPGAVYLGRQQHPSVGDTSLPLENVEVYQFSVRSRRGLLIPVNWTYVPEGGTFMWGNAPLQCEDGSVISNGSYGMRIRDNGTGGYLLGSNRCETGQVFGCQFDAKGTETACGACAWNAAGDVACTPHQ